MLEATSWSKLGQVPILGPLFKFVRRRLAARSFAGSETYWQQRYEAGRNSGAGSYGELASYKAEYLNRFVAEQTIADVIEFGCGDGNQLGLARYPAYLGFDVSARALALCGEKFGGDPSKRFRGMDEYAGERAELTLSLDVVYHLVEDPVFEAYMQRLFDAASRFVVVFSSNREENTWGRVAHVRHRRFTDWVERQRPGWQLLAHEPNPFPYRGETSQGSFADFHVFAPGSSSSA